MDPNMHPNTPLHWGYAVPPVSTPTQNHWIQPTQTHNLKRALSESDCDELYSEESSKEQISPSEPGSCQLMSRKKRRGVIEKKRRDRINSSLSELKRLVPSAYEKQGSAKLEKAEILQLTVEHLKSIHTKSMDALTYDPQRFAMDYHIIGFRECAAEVARYLVTIEGMDIQDPLRLRLMSHLQYFVQQRELSAKSCASSGGWTPSPNTVAYQPNCAVAPYQTYPGAATATQSAVSSSSSSSYVPNLPTPIHPYPALSSSPGSSGMHQQQHQQPQVTSVHIARSTSVSATAASGENMPISHHGSTQQAQSNAQTTHGQQATTTHDVHHAQQQQQQQQQQNYTHEHSHQDHQGATYVNLTSAQPTHSSHRNDAASASTAGLAYGSGTSQYAVPVPQDYNQNGGLNYVGSNGSKPYRPWGAEMAY